MGSLVAQIIAHVAAHVAAFGWVSAAELVLVAVGLSGAVFAAWRSIFRPSERRLRRGW